MTPRELTEQAQRDGAALERARILGVAATPADAEELAVALRAYHDGSERGELRRLLVRLWGPSPRTCATPTLCSVKRQEDRCDVCHQVTAPLDSDLRGLAARDSAPAHTGRCVCEDLQIPDCEPCPCDCHGPPSSYAQRELARLY